MNLFNVVDGHVQIIPETLLIPEFNSIFKNHGKGKAERYFSFIYFLCDFKSPYLSYEDTEIEKRCKKDFIDDLLITDDVKEAIRKYKEFQDTPSMRLLQASKRGCEEMIRFLQNIDLSEKTKTGQLLHKVTDLAKTLSDVAKINQNLDMLEESVKREHMQGKTKANKYISTREG